MVENTTSQSVDKIREYTHKLYYIDNKFNITFYQDNFIGAILKYIPSLFIIKNIH